MTAQPATEHPMTDPSAGARQTSPAQTSASAGTQTSGATRWVPILPGRSARFVLVLGAVVGIVGPVLLWLFFQPNRNTFVGKVGYLLVLVGLGVALVALALLLVEAVRLERTPTGSDVVGDIGRNGFGTSARVIALLGAAVILSGAFLLRPVEPTDDGATGRDGRDGRPGQGQGRGR